MGVATRASGKYTRTSHCFFVTCSMARQSRWDSDGMEEIVTGYERFLILGLVVGWVASWIASITFWGVIAGIVAFFGWLFGGCWPF